MRRAAFAPNQHSAAGKAYDHAGLTGASPPCAWAWTSARRARGSAIAFSEVPHGDTVS